MDDFEDAVQFHSAVRAKVNYRVTRNANHFPKSGPPVVTLKKFWLTSLERFLAGEYDLSANSQDLQFCLPVIERSCRWKKFKEIHVGFRTRTGTGNSGCRFSAPDFCS